MCWTLLQSLSQLLLGCRPLVSFVYAELDLLVQLLWSLAALASYAEVPPLENRNNYLDIFKEDKMRLPNPSCSSL